MLQLSQETETETETEREMGMEMGGQAMVVFVGVALLLIVMADAHRFNLNFSYLGATGPEKWGNLRPDYHECSAGSLQSPINIVTKEAVWNPHFQPLTREFNPANATLVDNGFNIAIQWNKGAEILTVDGKNYSLKQLHWHSPSEHTINGIRYSAELHLVHGSDDGNISVVSVLYKLGQPDPFLSRMMNYMWLLEKEVSAGLETPIPLGIVRTRPMKPRPHKYYRYMGSLTVPPCTEKIIWNIFAKVKEMSEAQLAALRAPLDSHCKHNARPLQPLNGRRVYLYDEAPHS